MNEIDAVITWVDGANPHHKSKCAHYAANSEAEIHDAANADVRFESSVEIYWCIASILKYSPFVRKIYIVTDAQKPMYLEHFVTEGIAAANRIEVIDHMELFRDHLDVLPTFNSRAIEAMLPYIKGLSEAFVYFNDNFFLNQTFAAENWFVDGKPVLRAVRRRISVGSFKAKFRATLRKLTLRPPNSRPLFGLAQEVAALLAGETTRYWALGHTPQPVVTQTLKKFYERNPDILRGQIRHRFRSCKQFNSISLAAHLEAQRSNIHPVDPPKIAYLDTSKNLDRVSEFCRMVEASVVPSGCVQDLLKQDAEHRARVVQMMNRKFYDYLPSSVRAIHKE